MKKILWILYLAFAAHSFFTVPAAASGPVKISGDPCSVPLVQKLSEAFNARNASFNAEIETVSCTLGVFRAASGDRDMGVSTQNGLSSNLPKGGFNTVIAKSPIVLIVNKENPVNNLSHEQLSGILAGKTRNWRDVGGKDQEILNIMLEPCVMNTLSKKTVPIASDINRLEKPKEKVNVVSHTNKTVAENEGAIGQQIYGYDSEDVKVLTIDGYLPDGKTVPAKYPFYQDYNVVTKGQPQGIVLDFIKFARANEGVAIIKAMRHIPVN